MPRYFDIGSTVLIVVGYGILAEAEDRPTAYELKRMIDSRGEGTESRSAVVVTDMWVLNQEMADLFPAQIYEELPVAVARDQRLFVQMNQDAGKRVALWGMDQSATREAVELFIKDGLLDRLLDLVWHRDR